MADSPIIFVDLGAFDGQSIRQYEQTHVVAKAYLWECNPDIVIQPPRCQHEVIRAAAWVRNGICPLYQGSKRGEPTQGSSLLKEKRTGGLNKEEPLWVDCIHFGEWLRKLDHGNIVVKMNIEGAEYKIFESLTDFEISIPYEWHVSFHNKKVGRTPDDDESIRCMLRSAGFNQISSMFHRFDGWRRTHIQMM